MEVSKNPKENSWWVMLVVKWHKVHTKNYAKYR